MSQSIYDELREEHAEMRSMIDSLTIKYEGNRFDSFAESLERHQEAEEDVLYNRLQNEKDVRPLVLEGIEEHRAVTSILRRLQNIDGGSEVWDARMKVLAETLEHHIHEEETELFPKAQKFIPADESMDLAQEFRDVRAQVHVHV